MKIRISILTLIVSFLLSGLNVFSQDADDILGKMDKLMFSAKDKQGKVKIILTNKSGKEKIREAEMMQKGTDKRLYRYTAPEKQAGIATLSLPDGVMWLYMPAFGKPKKISLLAKSQAFTGTDFSYEDMTVDSYAKKYTPALIDNTEDAYILELSPKSNKSDYSKLMVTVDKTNFHPILIEYYKRDKKFKEARYKYKKQGDYWYAEEVVMTDLRKKHSTRITLEDMKFDQGLSDEEFTVEKLKIKEE